MMKNKDNYIVPGGIYVNTANGAISICRELREGGGFYIHCLFYTNSTPSIDPDNYYSSMYCDDGKRAFVEATEEQYIELCKALRDKGWIFDSYTNVMLRVKVFSLIKGQAYLVRNNTAENWEAAIFHSRDSQERFQSTTFETYLYMLPYNDGSVALLGTANSHDSVHYICEQY